jgi:eukaryotic-like serine/threonine-protein kinase
VSTQCYTCLVVGDDATLCSVCGVNVVDENFGRILGQRYVVHQRITARSLGIVYRGKQCRTDRRFAIKLLPAHSDPAVADRFKHEAEVLIRLRSSSQHAVTLYDMGREADDSHYVVMEMPQGRSLEHVLREEGPLPWQRVFQIMLGLCGWLREAHALGVVHRDLKPENILLEQRSTHPDFVTVSDFGLPDALGADARGDLFTVGVLAYLLITGVRHWTPTPLASRRLPPAVESLIVTLMHKDPNHRYPDVPALAAELHALLAGYG